MRCEDQLHTVRTRTLVAEASDTLIFAELGRRRKRPRRLVDLPLNVKQPCVEVNSGSVNEARQRTFVLHAAELVEDGC